MDPDVVLIAIPIGLYLGPAALARRVFFGAITYATPKWLVYSIPLVAWLGSFFIRPARFYSGMGNFVYEPLLLSCAPMLFWLIIRLRQGSSSNVVSRRYGELALLVLIGISVLLAFAEVPGIGDWP